MNHIIKKSRVQADGQAPKTGGARGVAQVELLKDGEVVRAIEVRCACGTATVVELEYATDTQARGSNS